MKKHHIILLFLFSLKVTFSQTKKIEGDTAYWFKENYKFQKTLHLKDFEKSTNEFNFRFRNHGQVIEISKDSSSFNGILTNYIFYTKNNKTSKSDTIFNKIELSSKQVEEIYNIIQKSEILNLPTDDKIKNWQHGLDGITYLIEHSDKSNYSFKNYWTPDAQDSIPEAIIVLNLIDNLIEALNFDDLYTSFKNNLRKNGCYNSGGITYYCKISNPLRIGYSGAIKLPYGFYSSYSASNIGKTKINSSASIQYNFDTNGHYHLWSQFAKWNIFIKKSNFYDYIAYNYQSRNVDINTVKNKFENHQFNYGLNLKNYFSLGVGVDYLSNLNHLIGGNFRLYKWFSKPGFSVALTTSIFENQFNYKTEIFKSFELNNKSISLSLAYEDFMNYKDLYLSLRILL